MFLRRVSKLGLLVLSSHFSLAKVVPLIQPGFFFDYNKLPSEEPVPIPITVQCERIHIKWGRNNAIGQNPTAPYFLQVFTSTATTPFIIPAGNGLEFDWDVPFAPGTLYQICMFDTNGVPGGCQAMYTVVKNTTVAGPVCQNVTTPPQLAIDGKVPSGPISQYGFIDQCTDISITPRGGKPPYVLTVSPPLHPPYNITSNNMDPIVWTVSLSWSYPFFISLLSSDGQMWANGPMHAGGFGPNDCLAPGTIPHGKAAGIAAGASIGTLIAGVVIGYGGLRVFGLIQRQQVKHPEAGGGHFKELKGSDDQHTTDSSWQNLERPLPEIPERLTSLNDDDTATQSTSHPPIRTRAFILHTDGGRVHTETQVVEDIIELPPQYRSQSTSSASDRSSLSSMSSLQPVRKMSCTY